jgi:hypothetical protein
MTQLGEPAFVGTVQPQPLVTLFVVITSITFDSGIKIFDVQSGGAEVEIPSSGAPHWTLITNFPAVYVRQGGSGETKELKVKLAWLQTGHDGSAHLKGESADGAIVIEGDFDISGELGTAEVSCTFTTKPSVVANYGTGIGFEWTVTAAGDTVIATGGTLLRLFFVDAKPKPIGWSYKAHYLKVIDWTTAWAAGQAGEAPVLAAIWDKFSDGTEARNPHATGFSYWKTSSCIQNLRRLVQPDGGALRLGWSCKAIAHLFMECLALHGIKCKEVIPNTAAGMQMFLVHNWDVRATPIPNWNSPGRTDLYYAGSWRESRFPPLNIPATTRSMQFVGNTATAHPLVIDMKKRSGVPAQGQSRAPLGFSNHWIVEVGGKLYDTSYGGIHANDMTAYARDSLAGWLMQYMDEPADPSLAWLSPPTAYAWIARVIASHTLIRYDGATN